ncbi:hypothetical protein C2S51_018680 [Perilla frutescens var. frutescens]|nr:hypothetical protein C2S51_018680 [Perilla frutescens var. frutescens]
MSAAVLITTATNVITFISCILWCFLYSWIITIKDFYSCFRLVFHLVFQFHLHFWKSSSYHAHDHDASTSEPARPIIKITSDDVGIVMKQLGLPQQEPFSQDYIEIANIFDSAEPSLDEVREAFRMFDQNNDGFVDAEELKKVMNSLGLVGLSEQECKRMIMVFDDDGDGRISFGEFVKLIEENVCC